MLELDLIQTLAFAGVALLLGEGLRRIVPVLARYNLPAPVLGGLGGGGGRFGRVRHGRPSRSAR